MCSAVVPGGRTDLARPDRGRRGAGQVEAVAGDAGRIDVDDRQRGGRLGGGLDRHVHPVAVKVGPHQPPEPVRGEPAEEDGGLAEPGDGPRDVERAAAEPGVHVAGRIHDQVDQGLARDSDHARVRSLSIRPATSADAAPVRLASSSIISPLPPIAFHRSHRLLPGTMGRDGMNSTCRSTWRASLITAARIAPSPSHPAPRFRHDDRPGRGRPTSPRPWTGRGPACPAPTSRRSAPAGTRSSRPPTGAPGTGLRAGRSRPGRSARSPR